MRRPVAATLRQALRLCLRKRSQSDTQQQQACQQQQERVTSLAANELLAVEGSDQERLVVGGLPDHADPFDRRVQHGGLGLGSRSRTCCLPFLLIDHAIVIAVKAAQLRALIVFPLAQDFQSLLVDRPELGVRAQFAEHGERRSGCNEPLVEAPRVPGPAFG